MTVPVWRIAVVPSTYAANDLSGTGAKMTGGRWNSKGTPLVYCATNIALATLESVHYLRSGGLPFNRYLVRIDIPDTVWAARRVLDPLPGGWDAVPAGLAARSAGDDWIATGASALLLVPSVIVPDEHNVLINPQHGDAAAIVATTIKRWIYDPPVLSLIAHTGRHNYFRAGTRNPGVAGGFIQHAIGACAQVRTLRPPLRRYFQ